MEKISNSLQETEKIAQDWLAGISVTAKQFSANSDRATIVGLSGDLGSGKTTFAQLVAKNLGIKEFVTSPTFVIMKIYPAVGETFKQLIHIDAYRLEKAEEIKVLNLEKFYNDKSNLILIEWPEKVQGGLPADLKTIKFEVVGETQRKMTFN